MKIRHKIYNMFTDYDILLEFVNEHNIKDSYLDYLFNKISSKTYKKLRLIRSEKDSLLISIEDESSIEEVYQITKEGKVFKLNIPSSVLNYINLIRN